MTDNIFIISDASYSSRTKCAGLGVIDLHTGKKYSHSISNIQSSHVAEYRALLFSVRIAIENGYDNVVFVYDNRALNLDTLKLWLVDKIDSYQFLWLKRVFVDDADKLARKARSLHEKLNIKDPVQKRLDDTELLQVFTSYSQSKIIRAFMSIASDTEYEILKSYRNNELYPPVLVEESSLDFFSDVYNLLKVKKNRQRFYKFINRSCSKNINVIQFQTPKSQEHYISVIKNIIDKLGNMDDTTKKRIVNNLLPPTNEHQKLKAKIKKLKQKPCKEIRAFCVSIAKDKDKQFLKNYFSAKKAEKYAMDQESVELFLVVYYLLSQKCKSSFFNFIKNRLKADKKLSKLFYVREKEFYLNYLRNFINLK